MRGESNLPLNRFPRWRWQHLRNSFPLASNRWCSDSDVCWNNLARFQGPWDFPPLSPGEIASFSLLQRGSPLLPTFSGTILEICKIYFFWTRIRKVSQKCFSLTHVLSVLSLLIYVSRLSITTWGPFVAPAFLIRVILFTTLLTSFSMYFLWDLNAKRMFNIKKTLSGLTFDDAFLDDLDERRFEVHVNILGGRKCRGGRRHFRLRNL